MGGYSDVVVNESRLSTACTAEVMNVCDMVDDVLEGRWWSARAMQVLWVVFFVQIYRDGCSDFSLLCWLFFFCVTFFFPFPSLAATQIFSAGQDFAQLFGSYLEQFTCFLCCSLQKNFLLNFNQMAAARILVEPFLGCLVIAAVLCFRRRTFFSFSCSFSSDVFCFTSSTGFKNFSGTLNWMRGWIVAFITRWSVSLSIILVRLERSTQQLLK